MSDEELCCRCEKEMEYGTEWARYGNSYDEEIIVTYSCESCKYGINIRDLGGRGKEREEYYDEDYDLHFS